jgi:diaminopimelate decarboxylase
MNWWENGFVEVKSNVLFLGGVRAEDLARRHGTPLYVYGRDRILARYDALERALAENTTLEARIFYAMKANAHPGILGLLQKRGAGVDAVSPNEVDAALRAGFAPERILFTGTSVGETDVRRLLPFDGLTINIDAEEQLEVMARIRRREFPKTKPRVAVRWNPGIGRGFNARVTTAGRRSADGTPIKFGVEDKKVLRVFEGARAFGFEPVGLHQHLGSGWVRRDFPAVREAVDRMARKACELRDNGFPLEFLDFGGGFGPRYAKSPASFPVADYVEHISQAVDRADCGVRAIAVEPGKYLVGDAGVLLLRVVYLKESYGHLFACVDGGTYNTVPRPAIYLGARHEIINTGHVAGAPAVRRTVAGNLCETGDVFGKDRVMPRPSAGDVLAVLCAGAYCRSMASTFNLRQIPGEILI